MAEETGKTEKKEKKEKKAVTDEGIRAAFGQSGDFVARDVDAGGLRLRAYFIDGLTSGGDIADFVIKPLSQALAGVKPEQALERARTGTVYNAVAEVAADLDAALAKLVNGFTLILFPGETEALAFETKTSVDRGPSEPQVENTVKGARDAFTENMRVNTSLLRRHMRTPALRFSQCVAGRRTKTNVSVAWIAGVTDPSLVSRTVERLNALEIDSLATPAAVEESITGSRRTAFPLLQYTERTDRFITALLDGRIGILVDGLPMGYLAPVDLGRLMTSPEDLGRDYVSASAIRVLRYGALLASLLLPGLYVAMAAFHQEMIPTKLLLAIIESKESVPFPTILEVLGLLLAFEILQEAGLQLPQSIGQTVSIIGGLVVGTAAVEAKLISPAPLIVVSVAGICGFALPGRDFADAIRIWRLLLAVLASVAGLFGLSAGFLLLTAHLAGLRSYGEAYLAPFSGAGGGGAVLRRRLVHRKGNDA